jgi:hypothetical protein
VIATFRTSDDDGGESWRSPQIRLAFVRHLLAGLSGGSARWRKATGGLRSAMHETLASLDRLERLLDKPMTAAHAKEELEVAAEFLAWTLGQLDQIQATQENARHGRTHWR